MIEKIEIFLLKLCLKIIQTLSLFKAKYATCGKFHTIVIDLNDNMWSFDKNRNGQLGLGDTQDRNIRTQVMCENDLKNF